jgi:hypothetical protein
MVTTEHRTFATSSASSPGLYQVDGVAVRCLLHADGKDASD